MFVEFPVHAMTASQNDENKAFCIGMWQHVIETLLILSYEIFNRTTMLVILECKFK